MSENPPSSPVPPTPGEAAKVQPKKETVRIALPPKPTASPTVRLPSPSPSAAAPVGATAAPKASPSVPAPPAASPAPARPVTGGAPAAAMQRPMPSPISHGSGISGLDKGLAVAAAVCGLAFLIHVVLIALGITIE